MCSDVIDVGKCSSLRSSREGLSSGGGDISDGYKASFRQRCSRMQSSVGGPAIALSTGSSSEVNQAACAQCLSLGESRGLGVDCSEIAPKGVGSG